MIINVWFINGGYYRVLANTSTPVNYYHVKSSILEQNFIRFKWAAVILLKIHSTFSTPSSFLHIGVLLMLAQFDLLLYSVVLCAVWSGRDTWRKEKVVKIFICTSELLEIIYWKICCKLSNHSHAVLWVSDSQLLNPSRRITKYCIIRKGRHLKDCCITFRNKSFDPE